MKSLALVDCHITDRDLKLIGTLENLKMLDLRENTDITDSNLQSLCSLKNLDRLDISQTKVSPRGLAILQKFPSLSQVTIGDSSWRSEDIDILDQGLPRCAVDRSSSFTRPGVYELKTLY